MPYRAGHGVKFEIETDIESPGDFDVVGELSNDVDWPTFMRPRTEVLAHERHIDGSVHGVLKREAFELEFSYDHTDPTHEALQQHLRYNRKFGVRISGVANERVWVMSGSLESVGYNDPIGEGVRTMSITFWPDGQMIIDGDVWDGAPEA